MRGLAGSLSFVAPAKAGAQRRAPLNTRDHWIPACTGKTASMFPVSQKGHRMYVLLKRDWDYAFSSLANPKSSRFTPALPLKATVTS